MGEEKAAAVVAEAVVSPAQVVTVAADKVPEVDSAEVLEAVVAAPPGSEVGPMGEASGSKAARVARVAAEGEAAGSLVVEAEQQTDAPRNQYSPSPSHTD